MEHNVELGKNKQKLNASKISIIGFIFLMTIPAFVFAGFAIFSLIYWAMRYDEMFFVGVLGLIDCLFIVATLTAFTKKYAFTKYDYNNVNIFMGADKYAPRTHVEKYLVLNPDNTISVKEKKVGSGGDAHLLVILFTGLISLLLGVFRFFIELVRVLGSEKRKIEWEIQRYSLLQDIKKDGKFFWLGMIIMLGIFAVLWLITILL